MKLELTTSSLKNIIALAVVILILFLAYDLMTKPRTFQDCVLKNTHGGMSMPAARLIYKMCRDKFPE